MSYLLRASLLLSPVVARTFLALGLAPRTVSAQIGPQEILKKWVRKLRPSRKGRFDVVGSAGDGSMDLGARPLDLRADRAPSLTDSWDSCMCSFSPTVR